MANLSKLEFSRKSTFPRESVDACLAVCLGRILSLDGLSFSYNRMGRMMTQNVVFVNRRKGRDRRLDLDPCKDLPLDLYHRMRRKAGERRSARKSLSEDYYAYVLSTTGSRLDKEPTQN